MSKLIAGIVTAGAIGGETVGGYYAFNNYETIASKLKDEGYEPLDVSKTGDWTTVLDAYKKAKNNVFEGTEVASENEEGLKAKCRGALDSKTDNSKNYLLARQWCVKERKAEDIFKKLNLRTLKAEPVTNTGSSSSNPDEKYWNQKAEKYNNKKFQNSIEITPKPSLDKATGENIKKVCTDLKIGELKTTTDGFNETIKKAQEWCTIDKESN